MAFFGESEVRNRAGDNFVGLVNFPGTSYGTAGSQRSKAPITTGTSVLGVKFNGGVVIAADTIGHYGSLARFRNCPRIFKVNDNVLVGAGGDIADFHYVKEIITQKVIDDECVDDGFRMKPKALYNWLTRLLYKRRSEFDPLWNNFVIGGMQDDVPFLGTVDKLGTAFLDDQIATGMGAHLAIPMMREGLAAAAPQGGLTEQQAIALLQKCIEVLYYRDAHSCPQYHYGVIKSTGVDIQGPLTIQSDWSYASIIKGYE